MMAALCGHTAIVRLLIDRGAKVRFRMFKGEDARTYAGMGGHTEIRDIIIGVWRWKK